MNDYQELINNLVIDAEQELKDIRQILLAPETTLEENIEVLLAKMTQRILLLEGMMKIVIERIGKCKEKK